MLYLAQFLLPRSKLSVSNAFGGHEISHVGRERERTRGLGMHASRSAYSADSESV